MTVEDLAEKIANNFNFIYEIGDNFYILGRDYCKVCSEVLIDVYKGFLIAADEDDKIENYMRVRRYVSDVQPPNRNRKQEILQVIGNNFEDVKKQFEEAKEYANIAYGKNK